MFMIINNFLKFSKFLCKICLFYNNIPLKLCHHWYILFTSFFFYLCHYTANLWWWNHADHIDTQNSSNKNLHFLLLHILQNIYDYIYISTTLVTSNVIYSVLIGHATLATNTQRNALFSDVCKAWTLNHYFL